MDGFCCFVLDNAAVHPSFCFEEKSDQLNVSEIRASYPSREVPKVQIPDDDVESWLAKEALCETGNPAIFRMVWIPLRKEVRPWQLGIRRANLDAVLRSFKIEEAYKYGFTSPGSFALVPNCRAEDADTLVFSLCMPDLFAVVWKYDARTRATDAVCWAPDWISQTLQDVISRQKGWARHPLFLALVACIMLAYLLDRDLVREVKNVAAVENRTSHHGFQYTTVGVARGDYASLSQRMSGCAVSFAGLERIYKILNEFLGDLSIYSQRYGVSDDYGSESVNSGLSKCVETLQRRLRMQKIQIDYLSRRVEVQLTALFNLIAQKEAKVGIAVAEDSRTLASASKEDSTAMKTLAAVTVVFLPGTFVAAIFAMPLFDWEGVGNGMVVSKRFWIYWAVTVPLTILTLLIWALWTRRQARVHRISKERAREELWFGIEGESSGGVEAK